MQRHRGSALIANRSIYKAARSIALWIGRSARRGLVVSRHCLPVLVLCAALPLLVPARADAEGGTVVLGAYLQESSDHALQQSIEQRLLRLGEQVLPAPASSESLLACRDAGCMLALASQSGARRVVRVDVTRNGEQRYSIAAILADAQSGATEQRDDSCNECSAEQLRSTVTTTVAGLVVPDQAESQPKPPPPKPPAAEPPPLVVKHVRVGPQPLPTRRWTPARTALVALLGVSLLVSVVTTAVLLQKGSDSDVCLQKKVQDAVPGVSADQYSQRCQSVWELAGVTGGLSIVLVGATTLSVYF
jgi:hypothetical protein